MNKELVEKWFNWYTEQIDKNKTFAKFRERYLCPCCYMPTLEEREWFDICYICFWEDDGQDSDDAEIIRGGPNHDYSLKEARENFNKYHTMYRPSDKNAYECETKQEPVKMKVYNAFVKAVNSESDNDWIEALNIEKNSGFK